MMKIRACYFAMAILALIVSCNKNDDDGPVTIPPRDLAEVALEDDKEIVAFLKSHFYNYEEFQNPSAEFDYKIKIDTLEGDNATKTPLFDQVSTKEVVLKDGEGNDVVHKIYYLVARPGIGESPTIADSTLVRYQGELLNKSVFDGSPTPIWFDLQGVVRGFREFMPQMKTGRGPIDNGDGTVSFEDYGIGLVIMPSGLAYFSEARPGIPSYSPLVFKIDLLSREDTDHDRDGILSINEDVNGDGNLFDDDTDDDNLPNYLDNDDDGDGVLTINEYDEDNDGVPDDSDGDGIPDYLDNDNN